MCKEQRRANCKINGLREADDKIKYGNDLCRFYAPISSSEFLSYAAGIVQNDQINYGKNYKSCWEVKKICVGFDNK